MISARVDRILLAALLLVAGASRAEESADPQALQQLQQSIQRLERQRQQARHRLNESQRQLAEAENRIRRHNRQLQQTRRKLRQTQADIEKNRQALTELEQQQQRLLSRLALQWRSAYGSQRLSRLRTLLQSRDANAFFRWKAQQHYLDRQQLALLQALEENQQQQTELLAEQQQRAESLQELLAQQQQQLEALEQARQRWQQQRRRQSRQLRDTEQALAEARARRQRLQRLLEELDASLKALDTQLPRPFARLKGQLPWPVQGRLLHRYGSPRSGGMKWRGVELQAAAGASVKAIAHGRVVYADWLRGYGLLLILDHGDGYLSLYGQNAALFREVGEWVQAGDELGRLDETGRLYLELRHQGRPVNPEEWFRR